MKIIASNFKTNHTRKSASQFIKQVDEFIDKSNIKNDVLIFPSSTSLDCFDIAQNIFIGTQNAYPVSDGSYTGEIGTIHLDEFGIKTILIGHSERRHIIKEPNELIIKKYDFFKARDYKIVYCIGEPLEVKNSGTEAIIEYLFSQLEGIDLSYENLIIAYEPVWAIGTGVVATIDDINEIHSILKQKISAPILYGGSVKVDNIESILKLECVDGVLVGSGSWNVEDFIEMIKIGAKEK
ncbi:triose-phosphate isomerase [Arcobacter sp. FWKO B]|uniref:triose-phosphate isomerase n=1 Tax=Arcobacter sp. FWKO B TaxID=2593672 RepID=UPI0018A4386F|nr:triose-phosphate isomerase [Arcobacter sp. FWKO B]QOG13237.1 triose-phosphate isomerase [Arcobacter sp. FWKO B]